MADLLVSEGYADVGYEYVNVDDCWLEKSRGPRGELVADRQRFPRGMKSLGQHVIIYFRFHIEQNLLKSFFIL